MQSNADFDAELHVWCNLCAIQWACLPLLLSQPIAPVLFLFFPARYVISTFLLSSIMWTFLVAYRYKNLVAASRLSNFAYYTRWVVAVVSSIALAFEGQYLTASLAIAWPMIAIIIIVYWPADVAYIEDAFYTQRESLKWER